MTSELTPAVAPGAVARGNLNYLGIKVNSKLLVLSLGVALLASCATRPALVPGPHLTQVAASELPPPADVDPATGQRAYRIGALDTLQISVFGLPEVSRTIQVDSGGRLALPLVGTLEAVGHTPEELSQEIANRLRQAHVRNPNVAVNVNQLVSQLITIDGQVAEPGLYPVIGRMTLMRAIASAKGANEFARLQEVVVFRTVGTQEMAALYNLRAIRQGAYPDPAVYAGDVIVVGDSPARRLFRDVLQASPLFIAPIVALLQRP